MRLLRPGLACLLVTAACGGGTAHAQLAPVVATVSVGGPAKQHLPRALRVLVTTTGFGGVVAVRADVPGLRYHGHAPVFSGEAVTGAAGGTQRVRLKLSPQAYRYVRRHLPKTGIVVQPIASTYDGGGPSAIGSPIRLVP